MTPVTTVLVAETAEPASDGHRYLGCGCDPEPTDCCDNRVKHCWTVEVPEAGTYCADGHGCQRWSKGL